MQQVSSEHSATFQNGALTFHTCAIEPRPSALQVASSITAEDARCYCTFAKVLNSDMRHYSAGNAAFAFANMCPEYRRCRVRYSRRSANYAPPEPVAPPSSFVLLPAVAAVCPEASASPNGWLIVMCCSPEFHPEYVSIPAIPLISC